MSVIDLPARGASLFPMVVMSLSAVIYIIIETQMKTLHTTDNSMMTGRRKPSRSILTLAGIAIAVICSMALKYDARTSAQHGPRLLLLETPKNAGGLVGEVKTWL